MTNHGPLKSSSKFINELEMNNDYIKPPIVEALIDIQVQPKNISDGMINKLAENFKDEFPNKEAILLNMAQFNVKNGQTNFTSHEAGLKLSSKNKEYVLQLKKTGITFSILNAYKGWDDLYSRTKKIWEIFIKKMQPQRVTRVAVRYINRIDIPAQRFDFEEYFNICPKAFDADLSGFFLQVQIPQVEGGLAIIHQTATAPAQAGYSSILLDLDIFDFISCEPNDSKLWDRLVSLRAQKNNLFEKCITEKTRELFS